MVISASVMPGLGEVFLPNSTPDNQLHPLHVTSFPYAELMGPEGWCVVASSLPLWKKRKNVRIAYEAIHLPDPATTLEDLDEKQVREYEKVSFADECRWQEDPRPPNEAEGEDIKVAHADPPGHTSHTKSWIRGTNTLAPNAANGTCLSWRGKSWMMLLTASWQIIGLSTPFCAKSSRQLPPPDREGGGPDPEGKPEWLLTYFGPSYFTPSGIDIYCRNPHTLSQEQFDAIKAALQSFKTISTLTDAQKALAAEIDQRASELYWIPHSKEA